MRITDELRLFAADPYTGWVPTDKQQADLRAIADRIDAEHERQLGVLYRDMSDAEWIELPKDADGVPIHVGDALEDADNPTKPFTVSYIELEEKGWWVFACGMGRRPDKYRHVTPDTWERIIEDVLDGSCSGIDAVARCKALCERTKGDA